MRTKPVRLGQSDVNCVGGEQKDASIILHEIERYLYCVTRPFTCTCVERLIGKVFEYLCSQILEPSPFVLRWKELVSVEYGHRSVLSDPAAAANGRRRLA
ncbi:MAG: hypothetical protein DYG94_06335 [Leptolyngbya sp. PLA3]|nr:MAG: hypothetical protein EDM82_05615 [Cyanobacteria bacterium CYA]MCE7968347.1 hypothetical protein [Leptolyngbya sp. PL-A3]